MPDRPIRVALDERSFRQLCAGEVVILRSHRGEVVELVLADIGVVPMLHAVLDGTRPKDGGDGA